MNYILTELSAKDLGIVSANGVELRHSATERDIRERAIHAESTFAAACTAAQNMVQDVYVIDESGDSHYFGDSWTLTREEVV